MLLRSFFDSSSKPYLDIPGYSSPIWGSVSLLHRLERRRVLCSGSVSLFRISIACDPEEWH